MAPATPSDASKGSNPNQLLEHQLDATWCLSKSRSGQRMAKAHLGSWIILDQQFCAQPSCPCLHSSWFDALFLASVFDGNGQTQRDGRHLYNTWPWTNKKSINNCTASWALFSCLSGSVSVVSGSGCTPFQQLCYLNPWSRFRFRFCQSKIQCQMVQQCWSALKIQWFHYVPLASSHSKHAKDVGSSGPCASKLG